MKLNTPANLDNIKQYVTGKLTRISVTTNKMKSSILSQLVINVALICIPKSLTNLHVINICSRKQKKKASLFCFYLTFSSTWSFLWHCKWNFYVSKVSRWSELAIFYISCCSYLNSSSLLQEAVYSKYVKYFMLICNWFLLHKVQ